MYSCNEGKIWWHHSFLHGSWPMCFPAASIGLRTQTSMNRCVFSNQRMPALLMLGHTIPDSGLPGTHGPRNVSHPYRTLVIQCYCGDWLTKHRIPPSSISPFPVSPLLTLPSYPLSIISLSAITITRRSPPGCGLLREEALWQGNSSQALKLFLYSAPVRNWPLPQPHYVTCVGRLLSYAKTTSPMSHTLISFWYPEGQMAASLFPGTLQEQHAFPPPSEVLLHLRLCSGLLMQWKRTWGARCPATNPYVFLCLYLHDLFIVLWCWFWKTHNNIIRQFKEIKL